MKSDPQTFAGGVEVHGIEAEAEFGHGGYGLLVIVRQSQSDKRKFRAQSVCQPTRRLAGLMETWACVTQFSAGMR